MVLYVAEVVLVQQVSVYVYVQNISSYSHY